MRRIYPRADIEMTFIAPRGPKKFREYEIEADVKSSDKIIKDLGLKVIDGALGIDNSGYKSLKGESLTAFLQGIYLSRGRVFLPKDKSSLYQLEITFSDKKRMEEIAKLIESINIPIKKSERRKDNYILYIKDSELISDFLIHLKAMDAVLKLQSLIVERDVRNNTNRAVNCNVYNINKCITAASGQIEAIKEIDRKYGLNSLDKSLKELAELRLNNPEATLNELAAMLPEKVSKSCINHRMRKIMSLAGKGDKDV